MNVYTYTTQNIIVHVYEIPFTHVNQYIVYTQPSRCESVYVLLHSCMECVHVYVHMFVSHMLEPQIHVHYNAILCKKSHVMFVTNFHTGV